MRFWIAWGAIWRPFSIKSEKWHPKEHLKIDAEKVSKIDAKRLQNDAKIDAKINDYSCFSKKAKIEKLLVFQIENLVLGMQKARNRRFRNRTDFSTILASSLASFWEPFPSEIHPKTIQKSMRFSTPSKNDFLAPFGRPGVPKSRRI